MKSSIDEDYITSWLVLGPFLPEDLNTDFLADVGGEANIQPQEGDTCTTMAGETLTWERYNTKGNIVDLVDAVGYHEHAITYAFCTLENDSAGDAQIHLGSDDGIVVWINSIQVHSNPVNRPLLLDEDVFKANLKAGANHCLVKVSQLDDTWGFAMRLVMLPTNRAVLSGIITDETNVPIPNADVRLEQNGGEIGQTQTDASGGYYIDVYPVHGLYNLSATCGNLGNWRFGIQLREGERQTLNLMLKEAISIEGTILMYDNTTPHAVVPAQAVMDGKVFATTLSGERGKYSFINLKPGRYQVRCQIPNGFVYYGQEKAGELANQPSTNHVSRAMSANTNNAQHGRTLQVEPGKTLGDIDFCLASFKKGTWKNYSYFDGVADNRIYAIHRAPDGIMWFGTAGGVSRYDGNQFVTFTTEDGLAHDWVNVIYSEPNGVMWFGTWGGGVSFYDGNQFITFTTKDGLGHNIVKSIHQDSDGVMWFGTFGGVSRYDGKKFITFTTKDGLAHNWVTAIHASSDGTLWFGTASGVSHLVSPEQNRRDGVVSGAGKFVTFTAKDGLAHNEVTSIYGTSDGVLWFGTAMGVSRYDGKEFTNFTTRDGLVHNIVNTIDSDSDGALWFGTGDGASRYDGVGFTNFITEDGLADNWVYTVHCTPDNMLWFGTRSGVSRYAKNNYVLISLPNRNQNKNARLRLTDETGCFTFTTKDGLESNEVTSIYCTPNGVMWIGTTAGVSRYDGNQFVTLTTKDGLAYNEITAIYGTLNGVMWFGTRKGVSR